MRVLLRCSSWITPAFPRSTDRSLPSPLAEKTNFATIPKGRCLLGLHQKYKTPPVSITQTFWREPERFESKAAHRSFCCENACGGGSVGTSWCLRDSARRVPDSSSRSPPSGYSSRQDSIDPDSNTRQTTATTLFPLLFALLTV